MQDDIRNAIDQLQAAFADAESDGEISEEERTELRALVDRLGGLLDRPDDHDGLVGQIEGLALRLEERHPGVARVARGVVNTLSNYGI